MDSIDSFVEELRQTISAAKKEKEQEQARKKEHRDRWFEIRETIILPVLRQVAEITGKEEMRPHVFAELGNGGVYLKTTPDINGAVRGLSFWLSGSGERVICISAAGSNEYFTLDYLCHEVVERKALEFIRCVVHHVQTIGRLS